MDDKWTAVAKALAAREPVALWETWTKEDDDAFRVYAAAQGE